MPTSAAKTLSGIGQRLGQLKPGEVIKDQDGRWSHRCPNCGLYRILERAAHVLLFAQLNTLNPTTCPGCQQTYVINKGWPMYRLKVA